MSDIPIIFSAPMVRALLAGQKATTRRLAWRDAEFGLQDYASEQLEDMELRGWDVVGEGNEGMFRAYKPTSWQRVKPGDRLWVRENFSKYDYRDGCWYWADGRIAAYDAERPRPSIHMPRWASRLTLIVTATKIEPLQEISDEDAKAEGVVLLPTQSALDRGAYRHRFGVLWRTIHGKGPADFSPWDANPEVVAISFRVIKANIDASEPAERCGEPNLVFV